MESLISLEASCIILCFDACKKVSKSNEIKLVLSFNSVSLNVVGSSMLSFIPYWELKFVVCFIRLFGNWFNLCEGECIDKRTDFIDRCCLCIFIIS